MRFGDWLRRMLALAVVLQCLAIAVPATAEDDPKTQARALVKEAAEKFDAGESAAALELFEQAYALVPAPTILLYVARSHRAVGDPVAALRAYHKVVTYEIKDTDPDPVKKAIEDAKTEKAQVEAEVALVEVTVTGATGARVLVDGAEAEPLEGTTYVVMPGEHAFSAEVAGTAPKSENVTAAAGQRYSVSIDLTPPAPPPAAAAPPAAAGVLPAPTFEQDKAAEFEKQEKERLAREAEENRKREAARAEQEREGKKAGRRRKLFLAPGWLLFLGGSAGLGVGIWKGTSAKGDRDTLNDDFCGSNDLCTIGAEKKLQSAKDDAGAATLGIGIGGAAFATGITLMVLGYTIDVPKERGIEGAWSVQVSPGAAAVKRTF